MAYIAGQVALDGQGQLVAKDDFVQQVDQVFKNLDAALKSAAATFADVVKLNYFCVDRVDCALLPKCARFEIAMFLALLRPNRPESAWVGKA